MHVMIDLETFGTRPDAVIFQIGAVAFEAVSGGKVYDGAKTFNRYVDPDSCTSMGMTVDADTLIWWMGQSAEARDNAIAGMLEARRPTGCGSHIASVLADLISWPNKDLDTSWAAIEGVWAKPSVFDVAILNSAFRRCHSEAPWDRRRVFDATTLFHLIGGTPTVDMEGTPHDALEDCLYQVCQVQMAMAALSGG